jgi:hypothetical protein
MAFKVIYFPVYLYNLGRTELWILFLYCQGLDDPRFSGALIRPRSMTVMRDVVTIQIPAGKLDESVVKMSDSDRVSDRPLSAGK